MIFVFTLFLIPDSSSSFTRQMNPHPSAFASFASLARHLRPFNGGRGLRASCAAARLAGLFEVSTVLAQEPRARRHHRPGERSSGAGGGASEQTWRAGRRAKWANGEAFCCVIYAKASTGPWSTVIPTNLPHENDPNVGNYSSLMVDDHSLGRSWTRWVFKPGGDLLMAFLGPREKGTHQSKPTWARSPQKVCQLQCFAWIHRR